MKVVYFLTISILIQICKNQSRWQSQTRIWRIGSDEGTYRIPVGGGVTKTKEWIDGIPQTLQFHMSIPDDVFNGWGFVSILGRDERVFQIRAYLGVGQMTCAMNRPSYGALRQLSRGNPNIRPIGPHGRQYVGAMANIGNPIQSFGTQIDGIRDEFAIQSEAEYQEACVFIVCERDPNHSRGWPSRTLDDQHYCPVYVSFSWRPSRLKTDSPNTIDPNSSTDRTRAVTLLFWCCAIFDIIMLAFIGFATFKICFKLSESDEEEFYYY